MKHALSPKMIAFESKYTHVYKIPSDSVLIRNLLKDTKSKNIQGLKNIFRKLFNLDQNTRTSKVFTYQDSLYLLIVTEHKDKRKKGCELVNIKGFGIQEFIITCESTWSLRIHGETVFEIKDSRNYFLSLNWSNSLKTESPLFCGKYIMFFEKKNIRDDQSTMSILKKGCSDLHRLSNMFHDIRDVLENHQVEIKEEGDMENELCRLKKENERLKTQICVSVEQKKKIEDLNYSIKKFQEAMESLQKENNKLSTSLTKEKESKNKMERNFQAQLETQKEKIKVCNKKESEAKKQFSSCKRQNVFLENKLKDANEQIRLEKKQIVQDAVCLAKQEKEIKKLNKDLFLLAKKNLLLQDTEKENLRQEKEIKKIKKDISSLRDELKDKNEEYELLNSAWKNISSNKVQKKFSDAIASVCPYHDLNDMERLLRDIKMLYEQCHSKDDIFFVYRQIHLNKEDNESCQDYLDRLETMYDCLNGVKMKSESWSKFASRISASENRFKVYKDRHIEKMLKLIKEHKKLREIGVKNLLYAYSYEYVLENALKRFNSHREGLAGMFNLISKKIVADVRFFQHEEISSDVKVLSQMYASILARNYLFTVEFDVKGELFDKHRRHLWKMKTGELLFSKIKDAVKNVTALQKESVVQAEQKLSIDTGSRMIETPIGHTRYSWQWKREEMIGHTKYSSGNTTFIAHQIIPEKEGFFKCEKHCFLTYKHISIRNMRKVINQRFGNDITTPIVFFHAKITTTSLEVEDIENEDTFLENIQKPLYFYTCFKKK